MHHHRLAALWALVPYAILGSPLNARVDFPSLKSYHAAEGDILGKRHGGHGPEAPGSLPVGQPPIVQQLPVLSSGPKMPVLSGGLIPQQPQPPVLSGGPIPQQPQQQVVTSNGGGLPQPIVIGGQTTIPGTAPRVPQPQAQRIVVQQQSQQVIFVQGEPPAGSNAQVLRLSPSPPETTISYGGKRFKCMKRIGSSPVARPVMIIGGRVLSPMPISQQPPMPQLSMQQMSTNVLVGDESFPADGMGGADIPMGQIPTGSASPQMEGQMGTPMDQMPEMDMSQMPGIGNAPNSPMPGMSNSPTGQMPVVDNVPMNQSPGMANVPPTQMPVMNNVPTNQMPGMSNVPMNQMPGMNTVPTSQMPGTSNLPMNQMPGMNNLPMNQMPGMGGMGSFFPPISSSQSPVPVPRSSIQAILALFGNSPTGHQAAQNRGESLRTAGYVA